MTHDSIFNSIFLEILRSISILLVMAFIINNNNLNKKMFCLKIVKKKEGVYLSSEKPMIISELKSKTVFLLFL